MKLCTWDNFYIFMNLFTSINLQNVYWLKVRKAQAWARSVVQPTVCREDPRY